MLAKDKINLTVISDKLIEEDVKSQILIKGPI